TGGGGDHAGRGSRRSSVSARLGGLLKTRGRRGQIDAVGFRHGVVIVVLRRGGRQSGSLYRVKNVTGQHLVERDVVADHADHGGHVVVQWAEHRLVAIGPRHRPVFQGDVVERGRGARIGGNRRRGNQTR